MCSLSLRRSDRRSLSNRRGCCSCHSPGAYSMPPTAAWASRQTRDEAQYRLCREPRNQLDGCSVHSGRTPPHPLRSQLRHSQPGERSPGNNESARKAHTSSPTSCMCPLVFPSSPPEVVVIDSVGLGNNASQCQKGAVVQIAVVRKVNPRIAIDRRVEGASTIRHRRSIRKPALVHLTIR